MTDDLNGIYRIFRKSYGMQGWWPIINPETGVSEYRTGAPQNESDIFEIIMGAILTQNVAWKNVEKALALLKKKRLLNPKKLYKASHEDIAECITSTGYYNQKTIKIKNFLNWFSEYNFSFEKLILMKTELLREKLLEINGIGPETADSILLYGLERKIFVIDAYTKRIYSRLGYIKANESYDKIQELFHKGFKGGVEKYNEYHALIVTHGKDICKNSPQCEICCLNSICPAPKVVNK